MLRYTLLVLFVSYVLAVSFRNWYRALCLMLPLLAVLERPDMPRTLLGLPGLNVFNVLMLFILLGWAWQKRREGLRWQVPRSLTYALVAYLAVYALALLRMGLELDSISHALKQVGLSGMTLSGLVVDKFVNTLKWVLPGLLLCHGTNSPERLKMAIYSLLATGGLLAFQVISAMAPALLAGDDLASRALRVLNRDIGYHRVALATMFAALSWAFFVVYTQAARHRWLWLAGFGGSAVALAFTGGRAGAVAWVLCGALLALMRWRRLLIIGPVLLVLAIPLVPGLEQRLTEGFGDEEPTATSQRLDTVDAEGRDLHAITSGRILVWPVVVDKIAEQPWFGYGMRGMVASGVTTRIHEIMGKEAYGFSHPHNAYLEWLLENGVIGAVPVLLFYGLLLARARRGLGEPMGSPRYLTAGLVMAFVTVQLVASLGSESFYPRQSTTLMWCAIGLFLSTLPPEPRVRRGRRRRQAVAVESSPGWIKE